MRDLLALILPVALAARSTPISEAKDSKGETADWFKEKGLAVPEGGIAHYISYTADQNESHLFKLECLGCPFHEGEETWVDVDNSLLFNFTVIKSGPTILLNGAPIWPLASPPPSITAFQIFTDLPDDEYIQLAQRLDRYAQLSDSTYGQSEIGYKYAQLATTQPDVEWLQFDVTGIHMRQEDGIASYYMNEEGQRMFELLLHREVKDGEETVIVRYINDIQRGDREAPLKMPCGRDAMLVTEYNPVEWDEFGKIGTWTHTWNQFNDWSSDSWIMRNWLNIHFAISVFGIGILIRRRRLQKAEQAAAMRAQEDAEAALSAECHDAPPEYTQETVMTCSLEYGDVSEEEKSKYQL